MIKQTLRVYWLLSFLYGLSMASHGSTYVMFLLSHQLNIFEAQLVNVVFFTTLGLFEIPTGVVADVFGRKKSFVLACSFLSLAGLIYFFSKGFIGFAIAEIMAAVSMSFRSGAFQAWMVDRLKYFGYVGDLTKIFTKEQKFNLVALMVGSLSGSFLGKIDLALPWLVSFVVAMIVTVLSICLMKEEYFQKEKYSFKNGWQVTKQKAKDGLVYGRKSKVVRFVFLIGTIQFFAMQAPNMQWQPFFTKIFGNISTLGVIMIGVSLSMLIGSFFIPRFKSWFKDERTSINVSQIIIGIGVIFTAMLPRSPLAVIPFFLHEVFRGVFTPIKDNFLNCNIPSELRATLISVESISHHFGGVFGLVISGWVALRFSLSVSWLMSGLFIIFFSGLILFKGRKVE
jgi:MFS family permease